MMADKKDEGGWLARVTAGTGEVLVLGADLQWRPEKEDRWSRLMALGANNMTPVGYYAAPWRGRPGADLAARVAEVYEGKVELPDVPDDPPGTVY